MDDCVIANCWNVIAVLYVGIVDSGLVANEWGLQPVWDYHLLLILESNYTPSGFTPRKLEMNFCLHLYLLTATSYCPLHDRNR